MVKRYSVDPSELTPWPEDIELPLNSNPVRVILDADLPALLREAFVAGAKWHDRRCGGGLADDYFDGPSEASIEAAIRYPDEGGK